MLANSWIGGALGATIAPLGSEDSTNRPTKEPTRCALLGAGIDLLPCLSKHIEHDQACE